MDIPLDKAVPRALAAAAVVYCLWPSLMTFLSDPTSKPPKKLPELSSALLSPELPPSPDRDPFEISAAALAAAAKAEEEKASAPQTAADRKEKTPSHVGETTNQTGRRLASTNLDNKENAERDADPPHNPTLEATCIVGDRRLAIIDGRLYAPKEKIYLPALSVVPCEIIDVRPYKVVLKCGSKKAELTYPNVASSPPPRVEKPRIEKSQSTGRRKTPAKAGTTKKKR